MAAAPHRLRVALTCTIAATFCASAAAPADAHRYNVRVGLGDQSIAMFDHPAFQRADVRQVRYFLRWNAIHHRDERLRARRWVQKAIDEGKRPFIHLSTEDLRKDEGLLPDSDHYGRDVKRLVRYFRGLGVRDFGVWNEANHASQPTDESPWRAGRYFRKMYRAVFDTCTRRSCRVVALDVLDQAGARSYVERFFEHLGATCAHRRDPQLLRCQPRAAHGHPADRLKYLFGMARDFEAHVQRIYVYNWTAAGCDARFDAGLTNPDGTPRPGYDKFLAHMAHMKR